MFKGDFNPRTPVGCDLNPLTTVDAALRFQSTHPSGVRLRRFQAQCGAFHISIHAPQWGATAQCGLRSHRGPISIHAPQWGATSVAQWALNVAIFQSTHPSGVRPRSVMPSSRLLPFQSTHPSGVRLDWRKDKRDEDLFQSTHPSGVRPGSANVSAVRPSISIHAPQWGATSLSWDHQSSRQFQSTHPSGVRLPFAVGTKAASSFQSTHPSGVRRVSGGDGRGGGSISIHAPQWGATGRVEIDEVAVNHFNPRTPVGCDRRGKLPSSKPVISIHAPQWGATTL